MGSLESELNFDDYTLWQYSDDAFVEAVEDSRSLQAMIESLLNGVQRSHDNMQQRLNAKQEPSLIEKIHLRHIEGLITSIQIIQRDVDELVEGYKSPPVKSFFRTNYDQLKAIHRLLQLLPALRPFLPACSSPMETEYSPSPAGAPDRIEEAQQRIGGEDRHLSMAWSEASAGGWKPGGAACFDREPRSLTSLPEKETEEKLWWATPLTAQ